jgi:hypothetical protein
MVWSSGTAYDGLEANPAIVETAVRALAEGNALRATARIVQGDKDTGCAWLPRVVRAYQRGVFARRQALL